jgi:hypothetical protein
MAAHMLRDHGFDFEMIGKRGGKLLGKPIHRIADQPLFEDIHTLTMYINPGNQKSHYEYLFSLNPDRIIFNPGTENYELIRLAENRNIEIREACTLVLLRTGQYDPLNIS